MMNQLTVIDRNGKFVVDSREVAEMLGKEHHHLMRDIRYYEYTLKNSHNPSLDCANYFIFSTYKDSNGRDRPNCLLTREGCETVANKMTGEKGILFTAAYVAEFIRMETKLRKLDSYMIDDPIDRAKAWIGEQEEQRRLLAAKDETIAHKNEEINDLQETSGLTALQVMQAVNALKGRLSAITGKQFYSGMSQFQSEKDKVFRRFGVSLWEQIPKYKFDDLIKFIQGI